MSSPYFFSSLTRISDLASQPFNVEVLPRDRWQTGDYVIGQVCSPLAPSASVELAGGRIAGLLAGDEIVGAFGIRRATLEAVGDWQSIAADNLMDNMTIAGLFGKVTSKSVLLPPLTRLEYRGHVLRSREKVVMADFALRGGEEDYRCPTILIIGTSMSAGKTTTARIAIHQLKALGLRVVGAKFTGAGRYRDILAMKDAGADAIFDFVDVGLPSSICSPEEFRPLVRQLLGAIARQKADVAVIEAGASPFEPYNGAVVLEELGDRVCCTILCASDPYAVVGVSQSFGITPDLISGIAASTSAGLDLIAKIAGVKALTLTASRKSPELTYFLKDKLGL